MPVSSPSGRPFEGPTGSPTVSPTDGPAGGSGGSFTMPSGALVGAPGLGAGPAAVLTIGGGGAGAAIRKSGVLDAGHGVGASTPVASGTIRVTRNAATCAAADTGSMNQRIGELLS